jgi:flagellar hook-basal body complex protein FliE
MIEALSLTDFDVSSIGTQNIRTQSVQNSPATAATAGTAAVGDFGSVLASLARDAMGTVKGGEAAAISGIQGKVSTQKVVEAIMSAEQALQVAIAVRDKVVQAYQEIGRMAI